MLKITQLCVYLAVPVSTEKLSVASRTVEPDWQAKESLRPSLTEGPSSFNSSASFVHESASADFNLMNGLLKGIMLLLDPSDSRHYIHHTGIQHILDEDGVCSTQNDGWVSNEPCF